MDSPLRSLAVALMIAHAGAAAAQPGAGGGPPPPPYPPAPAPAPHPPAPAPYPPDPPQAMPYPPPAAPLTAEERELLARGEISEGARTRGAWANAFLGFGLGQAIQGRWTDTGWIFAFGEGASATAVLLGTFYAIDCFTAEQDCNDLRGVAWASVGAVAFLAFRSWSVSDALTGPRRHNQRVRELRARAGLAPYVVAQGGGMAGGLALRF